MIKQPILFGISLILLPVVLFIVANRIIFLANAKDTVGNVVNVTSTNDRCGSKKSRYACTKFNAEVQFLSEKGEQGNLSISAGSARGHGKPLSSASYSIGAQVPVRYNPNDIAQAYRDGFFDIWGLPFMTFIMQIATFFGSFAQGKQRRGRVSWR